jgi:hypothetical protein
MVRVSGITPSSSVRVLLPASGGMAGSTIFGIDTRQINLFSVFEKMLKEDVSFEHFLFRFVLLSSNTKRYGSNCSLNLAPCSS